MKAKNEKTPSTFSGKFTMKGDKFVMELGNMQVFFNGKTQWSYSPDIEEVSITEPAGEELAQTNPLAIIYSFRATSRVRFAAKSSETNYLIEMLPTDPEALIAKIVLEIGKQTRQLVSIRQTNKNGDTMSLTLRNFEKINAPDTMFSFDTKKYKNVNINDLR